MSGAVGADRAAANKLAAGDLDGDGKADLIGLWPGLGEIWYRSSLTGAWSFFASAPRDFTTGDMNADGRADLVGTWDGLGVYSRDSVTGRWVLMAPAADQVTTGDLDGDGLADLVGIWPALGGVWVKYSSTGGWTFLGPAAHDITTGKMSGGIWGSSLTGRSQLDGPIGGYADGPDLSTCRICRPTDRGGSVCLSGREEPHSRRRDSHYLAYPRPRRTRLPVDSAEGPLAADVRRNKRQVRISIKRAD